MPWHFSEHFWMSLCKVQLPQAEPTLVLSRDIASVCVSAGSVLHHCFPIRGVSWLLRGSRRPPQPAAQRWGCVCQLPHPGRGGSSGSQPACAVTSSALFPDKSHQRYWRCRGGWPRPWDHLAGSVCRRKLCSCSANDPRSHGSWFSSTCTMGSVLCRSRSAGAGQLCWLRLMAARLGGRMAT